MMLLLIVIVHLSYFRRKPLSSGYWKNNRGLAPFTALFLCCCSSSWRVNLCSVTNFLCFFTLETEFILVNFCFFLPHKAFSWSISEVSKAFVLLLPLLLSIMPIDSRTWYARIGVFQSTKIVMR